MTRYMADACDPANLPAGDLGAVYVDGICATTRTVGRRTISSIAAQDAHEGDVEPGNPGWSVWVPWVQRQRARGNPYPWLYCCDDGYGGSFWDGWRHGDGVAAFARAGVPEPLWRVFNFNRSAPPAYAVAVQVAVGLPPGYDWNILQDAPIPGLDAMPPPPPPALEVTEVKMYDEALGSDGVKRTYSVDAAGAMHCANNTDAGSGGDTWQLVPAPGGVWKGIAGVGYLKGNPQQPYVVGFGQDWKLWGSTWQGTAWQAPYQIP